MLQQEGETVDLSAYSEKQLVYHSALIIEAGLAHGEVIIGTDGEPAATVTIRLTWDGHDFLDAARNDNTWKKVMDIAKSHSMSMTFSIAKDLLSSLMRQQVGL
jgi:hypothetical protein